MCIFWNIYIFIYIQLNSLQQIHHFAPCFVENLNRPRLSAPSRVMSFPRNAAEWAAVADWAEAHTDGEQWGVLPHSWWKVTSQKSWRLVRGPWFLTHAFQLRHVLSRWYIEWFGTRKWLVTLGDVNWFLFCSRSVFIPIHPELITSLHQQCVFLQYGTWNDFVFPAKLESNMFSGALCIGSFVWLLARSQHITPKRRNSFLSSSNLLQVLH